MGRETQQKFDVSLPFGLQIAIWACCTYNFMHLKCSYGDDESNGSSRTAEEEQRKLRHCDH